MFTRGLMAMWLTYNSKNLAFFTVLLMSAQGVGFSQGTKEWIKSSMNHQPYPYPYYIRFEGGVKDGVWSLTGARTMEPIMEERGWVFPPVTQNSRRCQIITKSGKAINTIASFYINPEIESKPGKEFGSWICACKVEEELNEINIYSLYPNRLFSLRIQPPIDIEILVRESGNGGLAWSIASNISNPIMPIIPIITISTSNGTSWNDGAGLYLQGLNSSQNISSILKDGVDGVFKFEIHYGARRYLKYFTLGKGFSNGVGGPYEEKNTVRKK